MVVDLYRLQGYGLTVIHRLRRMAVRGGELFQSNRIFKGLCMRRRSCLSPGRYSAGAAVRRHPAPPRRR